MTWCDFLVLLGTTMNCYSILLRYDSLDNQLVECFDPFGCCGSEIVRIFLNLVRYSQYTVEFFPILLFKSMPFVILLRSLVPWVVEEF